MVATNAGRSTVEPGGARTPAGTHPATGFDLSTLAPEQVYKLLCGGVVPRPIAWVSGRSREGKANIGPFSFFNAVCSDPPVLGFAVEKSKVGKAVKDTLSIVRETREFVVNIPSADLLDPLAITAIEYGPDVDEFEAAGLTPVPGTRIAAPRIGEAPVSFECVFHSAVDFGTTSWVMGMVVYGHFREGLVGEDLKMDLAALRPLGRMAGPRFATEMNAVQRAARPAGRETGISSDLVWLRDGQ